MAGAVPQLSRGAALVGRRPKHPLVHVPTEGSYFQLVARNSGKCADVTGSSSADGANVEQRTCTTANNFLWSRS
jgi:hypothetical protein